MTRTIAIAALLAACADSGQGTPEPGDGPQADAGVSDPNPDPDPTPQLIPGGFIKLERFINGADERVWAHGELFDGHTGPGRLTTGFYRDFPADHCFAVPLMPAEPTFFDYLDVGDAIELRDPTAGPITMAREALLNTIFYRADNLSSNVGGVEYAVAFESASGALRMPAEPVVTSPGLAGGLVQLDELAIRWQPTGADRVLLVFQQGDVGRVCRLADDGEFTVPAEHSRAIPSFGTLAFIAVNLDRVTHQGREVELVGLHGISAEYER